MGQAVQDTGVSLALMALTAAVYRWTAELPADSAFFPRLIAAFIAVLAAALLVRSLAWLSGWRRRRGAADLADPRAERAEGTSGGEATGQVPAVLWRVVLPAAVAIVAYVGLLDRIGFFATTFLFVLGFSYALAPSKLPQLILAAAGFTLALYVIFVVLFRVPTPPGIVGF